MVDPFLDEKPEKEYIIPENEFDLVYSSLRFDPKTPIRGLYFPTRRLMFKIMRACIDVTDPDKLWFKDLSFC